MTQQALHYNPQLVEQCLPLWSLAHDYTFIRYVKNIVFVVQQGEHKRILRITADRYRTREEIMGELDFMLHLHQGGLQVAPPLKSVNESFIETLTFSGTTYHAVLFEHASGHRVTHEDRATAQGWNKEFFTLWAQQLALMHKLSKTYKPLVAHPYHHLTEKEHLKQARTLIPQSNTTFWKEYTFLLQWLTMLPTSPDCYGLIHGDIIHSNLFYDGKNLTFLDFEEYGYGWYAYDLAMSLFHIDVGFQRHQLSGGFDATAFNDFFIKTYLKIHPLDVSSVPNFIRLRRLSSYLWCHGQKKNGFTNIPVQEWCEWVITNTQRNFHEYTN